MSTTIQLKRGTAAQLAIENPILALGEPCLETDTNLVKFGDGVTIYTRLEYALGGQPVGSNNIESADFCKAFGLEANASQYGQKAFAGGKFSQIGDAQCSLYHLRNKTTNDTPAQLYLDGAATKLVVPAGATWNFDIKLTAHNFTGKNTAVWTIRGGIDRIFNDADAALIGQPTIESCGSGWNESANVAVTATDNALTITVTGLANSDIYWYATVTTSEIKTSTTTKPAPPPPPPPPPPPLPPPTPAGAFVDIESQSIVESLTATAGAGNMYPAFSSSIYDYCVRATQNTSASTANYTVTINGQPVVGSTNVNKCLRINDGAHTYYIRILPNNMYIPTLSLSPTVDYIPGWYLVNISGYSVVYSEYGVPVWYTAIGGGSLHKGSDANRLAINNWNGDRYTLQIRSGDVIGRNYGSSLNGRGWDGHEIREISAPASRKGNVLGFSYQSGLYIYEQTASGVFVWDWTSGNYLNTTDGEFFHTNSADVHPTTGNILLSFRHPSAIACIEYSTKNLLWVLQGQTLYSGTVQSIANPTTTATTKWLTPTNEPVVSGFQYAGPRGNHDARWHDDIAPLTAGNQVISVYDDQTGNNSKARGVIYEIDLTNNAAIYRGAVYHDCCPSGYMGSYTIVREENNTTTHTCDWVQQHPNLVEYAGGTDGMPTQTKTLAMDFSGDVYRLIKVRRDHLNIDYMRNTAGQNLTII